MTEFKREDRYVVLKIKDLHEYLPQPLIDHLYSIALEVAAGRRMAGREPLECVVVEDDWPEYETVWAMIQSRIEGRPNELPARTLPIAAEHPCDSTTTNTEGEQG